MLVRNRLIGVTVESQYRRQSLAGRKSLAKTWLASFIASLLLWQPRHRIRPLVGTIELIADVGNGRRNSPPPPTLAGGPELLRIFGVIHRPSAPDGPAG